MRNAIRTLRRGLSACVDGKLPFPRARSHPVALAGFARLGAGDGACVRATEGASMAGVSGGSGTDVDDPGGGSWTTGAAVSAGDRESWDEFHVVRSEGSCGGARAAQTQSERMRCAPRGLVEMTITETVLVRVVNCF